MIQFPVISRLILSNRIKNVCNSGISEISTLAFPLQFKATPDLWAEPLKKKKKIDPNIIKAREERKKKRIEKEIRKLQKLEKQLKPIAEFTVPEFEKNELELRKRNIKLEESKIEERILLLKDWNKLKWKENNDDMKEIKRLMNAQKKALKELRLESEDLYQAAVKIDENLIPFKFKGPTVTPRKDDYPIPDGDYIDVSKKWI